jgi:hypothetical protein
VLPTNDNERKAIHLDAQWEMFPLSTIEFAKHIQEGADKWCDGVRTWDRSKSPDEVGSLMRHLFEFIHHPTKTIVRAILWRAFALCEKFLEQETTTEGEL